MSLHVRHAAWLWAAPEKDKSDKSDAPAKSRMQQLKDAARDDDFEPDMPDPGAAAYLLGHFWAVGPTMGDEPVTDTELRNHQKNMGIRFSPWECATIKRLSREFAGESQKATKRDAKPPFANSTDTARLRQAEIKRKLGTFLN